MVANWPRIAPTIQLYNRLLRNYMERGALSNLSAMEEVVNDMKELRLPRNFFTYDNMITAYTLAHQMDKAEK